MPKFTTTLEDSPVRTFVQEGVVDTSTADAISAVGELAYKVGSGQAVGKLKGGVQNIDEVTISPLDEPTGDTAEAKMQSRLKQISELNTLAEVAAARKAGSLSGAAASARAKVLFKKAMADSGGMYGPELRKAFGSFFVSSVDQQAFFQDRPGSVDPATKGRNEAIQQMSKEATLLGIPFDTYAKLAGEEARNKFIISSKLTQAKLTQDDVANLTSASFNSSSNTFTKDMFQVAQENGSGVLNNDQIREFKGRSRNHIINLKNEWSAKITETGRLPTQDELDYFDAKAKEFEQGINTYLSDTSLQKAVSDDAETLAKWIQVSAIKAYPNLAVANELFPGQSATLINYATSPDYAAYIKQVPALKLYTDIATDNGISADALVSKGLDYLLTGEAGSDPLGAALAAGFMKNKEIVKGLSQDKINEYIDAMPSAISTLNDQSWRNMVSAGQKKLVDVESSIKTALDRTRMDYSSSVNSLVTDITITPKPDTRSVLGGPNPPIMTRTDEITDQDGNRVSNAFYTAIHQAEAVARRFPELWEGKFDTSMDYVKSLVIPKKQEQPVNPVKEVEVKQPDITKEDAEAAKDLLSRGKTDEAINLLIQKGLTPELAEAMTGLRNVKLEQKYQDEINIKLAIKEGLTREEAKEALGLK
jgi:hypothetical protein